LVDPIELFQGTIIIVAPHMDDEVLACGGTIARLPQKERIHVIYATDGMKSPSPIVPWRDSISPDLGEVRMRESRAAMQILGVPDQNTHFLNLPEARLKKNMLPLRRSLNNLIEGIRPMHILIPFRYDRHPDHLTINHIITTGYKQGLYQAQLTEYFVYYRWRLLPARDVRQYIQPQYLLEVNIQDVSDQKRTALGCFKSQTTKFYPWQTRPILTPILLDEVSQTPELFLRYDAATPGAAVFSKAVPWIRLVHRLEPFLQKWKYQVGAFLRRGLQRNDRNAA
jgi:LmbE family N-acetylglucosaminyl deacetylase